MYGSATGVRALVINKMITKVNLVNYQKHVQNLLVVDLKDCTGNAVVCCVNCKNAE